VNFEKELMVSFFMVRALIERGKVSSRSRNHSVLIHKAPWNGKPLTRMDYWCIEQFYHLDREQQQTVSIDFLANQFIHARIIYAMRDETRNWSSVLLCSDYDTKKALYRVTIADIQKIFRLVGSDYVSWSKWVYDEKLGDYRVTTD